MYCSVRHSVPTDLLSQGIEPGIVKRDGNCLYHALAMLCLPHQETDSHCIKLGAIVHACLNEEVYVEQVKYMIYLWTF